MPGVGFAEEPPLPPPLPFPVQGRGCPQRLQLLVHFLAKPHRWHLFHPLRWILRMHFRELRVSVQLWALTKASRPSKVNPSTGRMATLAP